MLSVDARRATGDTRTASGFEVTTHGGRRGTGVDAVAWAARAAELGAGEILLNSMDADGTQAGFDLELIAAVRAVVSVPVIASGGAGSVADFAPAVAAGADAVLAASVFHFGALRIAALIAGAAGGISPIPDIVWDGCTDPAAVDDGHLVNCINANKTPAGGDATYANADLCGMPSMISTDASSVTCEYEPLPPQQ